MKRYITLVLSVAMIPVLFLTFSCAKVKDASHGVGEATGKTIKTIKEVPGEVREGYREGRNPQQTPAESDD